jgi:hypothetical protein
VGHENSGEGDPSERFRPRPPPPHPTPPPPRKKPRVRGSNRAVELASNRVHARRQAGRGRSSGRALAGSEVTDSQGEGADGEQQLTRARLMSPFALREPKYSARPCLRREVTTVTTPAGVRVTRRARSSG